MKKDNNKMGKADLLSLDINKMVSDINEQKAADNVEEIEASEAKDIHEKEQEIKEGILVDGQKDAPSTKTEASVAASAEGGGLGVVATEQEEGVLWQSFLENLKETGSFVKKEERKSYWIDDDIVNTLKSIDLYKMPVSDIINAVLRSFITHNKESFRKFVKKREVLI